jgi:hypothetical protein
MAELQQVQLTLGAFAQFAPVAAQWIGRQHDVVDRRESADQVELLEDEPERASADAGQEPLGQAGDVRAIELDAAGGWARVMPLSAQNSFSRPWLKALRMSDSSIMVSCGSRYRGR